ncbi:hypothetical protein MMC08_007308, partial [Hypocenomyce scalaris]|nr:hypothetical protein [Hypocenomyce scalaris]
MPALTFTLSPEGVVRVHDAILCLAKFSETVSLEARRSKLILTALNSSKSAYASFALESSVFFEKYEFSASPSRGQRSGSDGEGRFTCQIYNK